MQETSLPLYRIDIQLENIEDPTRETLEKIVHDNIAVKMDTYLKKIHAHHPQSEVIFTIKVLKNKIGKFNGVFVMDYHGCLEVLRYEREDFVSVIDLINHAFQNFKERLSH